MAVVTALPHCPRVAICRILPSVVVAMVTTVTLLFELPITPLLSVMVLVLEAAASFGRVELMLCRGFLEVVGAQVLLCVEVPMEGLLLS